MKSIFSNTSIRNGLLVVAGIFLGWLFFHPSGKTGETQQPEKVEKKPTIWTCSMHPQIRRTEPGKCPICGMDLIPLVQQTARIDP
ncbi:MAG: heavy metal-binding domain-containing protein, partial [Bacteroidota bacterium]|nr:heavy metal-binding domain-containing protein [Bacteroidota bacterium]